MHDFKFLEESKEKNIYHKKGQNYNVNILKIIDAIQVIHDRTK
jgi:hypothetical protein